MLEYARQKQRDFFTQALQGDDPKQRVENLFCAIIQLHQKSNFIGGCIFGNTALEMSGANECYRKTVDHVFHEMRATLCGEVMRGQQCGQFRDDITPETLARHMVVTIEGAIMLARASNSAAPLEESFSILKTYLLDKGAIKKGSCA